MNQHDINPDDTLPAVAAGLAIIGLAGLAHGPLLYALLWPSSLALLIYHGIWLLKDLWAGYQLAKARHIRAQPFMNASPEMLLSIFLADWRHWAVCKRMGVDPITWLPDFGTNSGLCAALWRWQRDMEKEYHIPTFPVSYKRWRANMLEAGKLLRQRFIRDFNQVAHPFGYNNGKPNYLNEERVRWVRMNAGINLIHRKL